MAADLHEHDGFALPTLGAATPRQPHDSHPADCDLRLLEPPASFPTKGGVGGLAPFPRRALDTPPTGVGLLGTALVHPVCPILHGALPTLSVGVGQHSSGLAVSGHAQPMRSGVANALRAGCGERARD
jgi:hypothetical protein